MSKEQEEEDEDDYLTMSLPTEPSTSTSTTSHHHSTNTKKESLTQASRRKQREAETRGRPKSKAQLRAEEAEKREAALKRSTLDPGNRGFRMMQKLGYVEGTRLGKQDAPKTDLGGENRTGNVGEGGHGNGTGLGFDAAKSPPASSKSKTNPETDIKSAPLPRGLLEPVTLEMKEGRSGIGADTEKKRKFREEVEARTAGEKRVKVDQEEFRERVRGEREERRREGMLIGAMKVAERLDEEDEREQRDGEEKDGKGEKAKEKPLGKINVLWRGALRQRALAERDRRMAYDLHQSLSRLPTYEDPDEDEDDKKALDRKRDVEVVDLDLDQEDSELDEFEALGSAEKLERLVGYLRERWQYCFWCKYRYPDGEMDGCPGLTEDDHD